MMGPEAAPNYERRRLSLRGAVGADSSGEHTASSTAEHTAAAEVRSRHLQVMDAQRDRRTEHVPVRFSCFPSKYQK